MANHHTQPSQRLTLNEFEAADMIGMSVSFLRKDRLGAKLLPYFRIGNAVRYSPDTLRQALAALRQGGAPAATSGGQS